MRSEPRITEVPDVVGLSADDACAVVRAAGLVPRGPNSTTAPTVGTIIAQRPIAMAGAVVDDPVILWTVAGPGRAGASVSPIATEAGALDPV